MAEADRVKGSMANIEQLRQRVRENPNRLEPLRTLGWELFGVKRLEEAMEVLQEATSKFPDDPESHYGLGLVLKKLDREGEARRVFEGALEAIQKVDRTARMDMMRRLARGQLNQLDHGSWDIPDASLTS